MSAQPSRYSPVAVALHWTLAALLSFQLGLGWHMSKMSRGAAMFDAFQFHKSIGIVILTLSLVRVVVRLRAPRPAPMEGPIWQKRLASGVHRLLYLFMIGGPLTGWAVVSTAPISIATLLFHTVPLPHLPLGHGWHVPAQTAHTLLALLGVALVALHVAGALRHQLGGKVAEFVLPRMLPAFATRVILATAAVLAGLAAAFALPWLVYQPSSAISVPTPNVVPSEAPNPAAKSVPSPAPSPEDVASQAPPVQSADWQIEPGGKLGFSASVNGAAVTGRFSHWNGQIRFDPEHPEDAKVAISVDLPTAATDDVTRDSMLMGPEFFGSSPAHRAIYVANGFHRGGGTQFTTAGTLSINGVHLPVSLTFDLSLTGDTATAEGTTTLDRTALKVGTGQWASTDQILHDVGLDFSFKAHRKSKRH